MPGGGWGRGRRRRAVRMLEPVLLLLLHQGEAHGYTFLERLDEFGLESLNPSVVYRALRDMEDRGWVGSTWDEEETQGPPRRVYRITAEGDEALRLWAQELRDGRARIDHLLNLYDRHMAKGEGEYH
jgi:PadR family transcriptional regulator, regulatory protein PadR